MLRPSTSLHLSFRLPPTCDHAAALDGDPARRARRPAGRAPRCASTTPMSAPGWNAPSFAPWLAAALDDASAAAFGQPARTFGEGGSIPFMGMLGERFPAAQFVVTGVLVPGQQRPRAQRVPPPADRPPGHRMRRPPARRPRLLAVALLTGARRLRRGRPVGAARWSWPSPPSPATAQPVHRHRRRRRPTASWRRPATRSRAAPRPDASTAARRRSSCSTRVPTSPCSPSTSTEPAPPMLRHRTPTAAVLRPAATDVTIVGTGPLVVERHHRPAPLRAAGPHVHARVSEGTSGAPLVDDDGRVLGIVVLDNRPRRRLCCDRGSGRPARRTGASPPRRRRPTNVHPQRAKQRGELMRRSSIRYLIPLAAIALVGAGLLR